MIIKIDDAKETIEKISKDKTSFSKSFFLKKYISTKEIKKQEKITNADSILLQLISSGYLSYKDNIFHVNQKNDNEFVKIIKDPNLFCISSGELDEIILTIKGKS